MTATPWNGGGGQASAAVMPPTAPDRLAPPEPPPPPHVNETRGAGRRPPERTRRNGRWSKFTSIRAVALLGVTAIVIAIGVTGIGPAGVSVTASVKNFLLDWESRSYPAAAAMTTGDPVVVTSSLRSVYRQLGAQDLVLGMGQISVRGDQATAHFNASFDLGRGGLSWHYTGSFKLRRTGSGWRVVWSPSDIVPGLAAGDRLAVLTTMPRRAVLLDAGNHSLITPSPVIELGVIPARVTNPTRTAQRLAKAVGLAPSDADEMTGQIEAWPPKKFLELVQLSPASYRKLRRALNRVPHLRHQEVSKRLFESLVPVITGGVATETAKTLIDDGEPYRPGTTVGLGGLEQTFQPKLAGKPTTEIIVQNSAGKRVRVLHRWVGSRGIDVHTTINSDVQQAASNALNGVGLSAAIIAVRAGSGQILAVARHTAHGAPTVSPLDGQYQPGQSFTIVSTAALLSATPVNAKTQVGCYRHNPIGQQFVNVPAENLGARPTFREVFAHACSTAFVVFSLVLTSRQLIGAARLLGIGGPAWKLPLPAFPGRISSPGSNTGELAADMIGAGSVVVSPLDMALVAGAVESGSWHAPLLVGGPSTQAPSGPKLSARVARQLRDLMRSTVKSGAARAANASGGEVFGQVGSALLAGHKGLRAIWFVGFRGSVAFAVVVFARSTGFAPAVQIAGRFASGLPTG
jgi:cell division protein FtsI/penicillin-binding protein 2